MRKRRLLISVISLALLALVALVVFWRKPSMPSYNGKPLSEWTQELMQDPGDTERQEAVAAIRSMCSDKIPTLVSWLDYEPGERVAKIYHVLQWLPNSARSALEEGPLADRKELRAETAQIALATLGPQLGPEAAPALPQLARLINSTNDVISERATSVASRLGTNGLAILLPVAADETNPRHHDALVAIDFMSYLGTNGSPALPMLVRCTQSKNPKTVRTAAQALGNLKLQPETSVPALVAVLSNPDPKARAWAAYALGRFGQPAKPAIPSLIQLFQDPALEPRQEATNALRKIAPEVLTNASAH